MDGSVSYSGSLRNCAMVCSLRRVKHKCKEQFGSYACNNCRYNICEYADIDPKQAKLFVMQTDFEAQDTVSYNRTTDIVFWFFILGFLALGLHSFNHYHPGQLKKYFPNVYKVAEKTYIKVVDAKDVPPYKDRFRAIEATLDEVCILMLMETDVDNDGVINCHDSACLFYMNYPFKDEVRVIMNINKPKMNHLFVAVLVNGTWRYIEPWARYRSNGSNAYYMTDYWGSSYNPKYNEDATETVRYLGWIK